MEFIPEPYCSAQDAVRTVYCSKFQEPRYDDEIHAWLKALADHCRLDAENEKVIPTPPPSLSGGRLIKRTPDEAAAYRADLKRIKANQYESLSRIIEAGGVLNFTQLLLNLKWDGTQNYMALEAEGPQSLILRGLPSEFLGIAKWRIKETHHQLRAALCAGSVRAYYPCIEQGMTVFRTPNFWLDDTLSESALSEGRARLESRYSPGSMVPIRFNKTEMAREFPPFAKPGDFGGDVQRLNLVDRVADFLRTEHPSDKPYPYDRGDKNVEQWQEDVRVKMGESTISKTTFINARKLAYGTAT